jgi:hypothetical protein
MDSSKQFLLQDSTPYVVRGAPEPEIRWTRNKEEGYKEAMHSLYWNEFLDGSPSTAPYVAQTVTEW